MNIQVSSALLHEVIQYCKNAFPHEACGVWLGQEQGSANGIRMLDFRGVTNISPSPEHQFVMHPEEWIELFYRYQQHPALRLAGIFHSHPRTPAQPSDEDLSTLWKEIPTYWIISLQQWNQPEVGAFRFTNQTYERLTFNIIGND